MSDDKTIPPSKKRLEEAIRQGSGPFSSDMVSALLLLYALLYFNFMPIKKLAISAMSGMWSMMERGVIDGKILAPLLPLIGFFVLFSAGAIAVILAGNALQGKTGLKRERKIAIKEPGKFYQFFYQSIKCICLFTGGFLLLSPLPNIFFYLLGLTAVLFGLSALDLLYRRWYFQKGLWMTPEEAKQERNEQQGSGEIKLGRRRR